MRRLTFESCFLENLYSQMQGKQELQSKSTQVYSSPPCYYYLIHFYSGASTFSDSCAFFV